MSSASALVSLVAAMTLAACGSRTGLLTAAEGADDDAGAVDAAPPVAEKDASFPTDAAPSTLIRVLVPSSAPEGIYQYALGEFDPASGTFSETHALSCIAAVSDRPVALAAACDGTVFIQFTEKLWAVDPATLDCTVTPFDFTQQLVTAPSLTFSRDLSGVERLYFLAPLPPQAVFGVLDRATWSLATITRLRNAAFMRTSGTASGEVFALSSGTMARLEDATGYVTQAAALPPGFDVGGPFAFWGGAFYLFDVQSSGTTNVMRWSLGATTGSLAAQTSSMIVAAGASPCAPQ